MATLEPHRGVFSGAGVQNLPTQGSVPGSDSTPKAPALKKVLWKLGDPAITAAQETLVRSGENPQGAALTTAERQRVTGSASPASTPPRGRGGSGARSRSACAARRASRAGCT